jgi:hypothetical protein
VRRGAPANWEEVSWGLGRGDDDGLNNDKEPSNEEILRKDKEQGQDDLAKIHSPGCTSLYTNTPNPN